MPAIEFPEPDVASAVSKSTFFYLGPPLLYSTSPTSAQPCMAGSSLYVSSIAPAPVFSPLFSFAPTRVARALSAAGLSSIVVSDFVELGAGPLSGAGSATVKHL